jgi:hypothetical protein
MGSTRYPQDIKIAASEYGSDIGYLVREFEIQAERKKVETKIASNMAKEEIMGSKKRPTSHIFRKSHTLR